jgi:ABC-type bacteriocin/lantibiotic exporter with double-glycine peptidase domain
MRGTDGRTDGPFSYAYSKAHDLPNTIMGYVVRFTGKHQLGLAVLSAAVFLLSTAPLELQRRIINDAIGKGASQTIFWLALAYGGVAVAEQSLKMALNVYRGWVAEDAVRMLRGIVGRLGVESGAASQSPADAGIEIAMILEEVEPIGGFTGTSVSEPLLQGGILASVMIYMVYLEPYMALLSLAFFAPQMVFVPLLQFAINRRAQARILTKREISGAVVEVVSPRAQAGSMQSEPIERVFTLNMGIYKLKYSMNLLMNLTHHLAVAVALGIGGWFAVEGRIEVGTVVAIVVGLGKLNTPWGDLVDWARDFSVVSVRYRLFADAANRLAGAHVTPAEVNLPDDSSQA